MLLFLFLNATQNIYLPNINDFTAPLPQTISASIILRWMTPPTMPILTSRASRFRSARSPSHFHISSGFHPRRHENRSQSHPAVLFLSALHSRSLLVNLFLHALSSSSCVSSEQSRLATAKCLRPSDCVAFWIP
ncbi:hypothetical protein DL93DRAFT_939531 [Clavulina sp. PMI_390]|nr:hypothetical protein DL93DRAFT_939531 [Clavulina sp. PMI_390]